MLSFNDYVVLWAPESTPPTPGEPYDAVEGLLQTATADIVYQDTTECSIVPEGENVGNDVSRGSNDGKRSAFIPRQCSVTITVPLRAIPESGVVPYYDAILGAGNLASEIDGGSVLYRPATRQQPAATVYKFHRDLRSDNWRLRIATGVKGNIEIVANSGEEPRLQFTGTGQYQDLTVPAEFFDPDTGQIALQKDGSTVVVTRTTGAFVQADQDPMTCANATFSMDDGDTFDQVMFFQSWNLNLNFSTVDLNPVQGASIRRGAISVRNRGDRAEGSGELVDYSPAVLSEVIDGATTAKQYLMDWTVVNGEGTIAFSAPSTQLLREEEADNGGATMFNIPFRLNGTWASATLDTELLITYTAAA